MGGVRGHRRGAKWGDWRAGKFSYAAMRKEAAKEESFAASLKVRRAFFFFVWAFDFARKEDEPPIVLDFK